MGLNLNILQRVELSKWGQIFNLQCWHSVLIDYGIFLEDLVSWCFFIMCSIGVISASLSDQPTYREMVSALIVPEMMYWCASFN